MRQLEQQSLALDYITEHFAVETSWQAKIRKQAVADQVAGMQLSPAEAASLSFFAKLIAAKNILEVGTLYGYSCSWLYRALPHDGRLISLEKNPQNYLQAKKHLPVDSRLELREGDALEQLSNIQQSFDLVFIDANKAAYCKYLDWAEEYVRPGGLIIGDNTFLFGHVYGAGRGQVNQKQVQVMQEFNRRLSDKSKYNAILLNTAEGLTVAQKI